MAKKCYAVMTPNQDWFICHKAKGRDYGMKGKEADMGVWSEKGTTAMIDFIGVEKMFLELPKSAPAEANFFIQRKQPEAAGNYAMTIRKGQYCTVKKDANWVRRRYRFQFVYEGRCDQLKALRGKKDERAYGEAVRKYTRARTAWRNFRGWW